MIYGIGTDLMRISQIQSVAGDARDPFMMRMFTAAERKEIDQHDFPQQSYATHFCGKEAVFKSFHCARSDAELSDIEVLNDSNGSPYVLLHGNALSFAKRNNITKIHISLSFDSEYASAFAIAESD